MRSNILTLPSILILIPFWKRPEISEICFSGLDRARAYREKIEVLAIISEDDYKAKCAKHGIEWTYFENQPLGRKKNHGLNEALKKDWDYLMELNSDDIVKNELFDLYDSDNSDYLGLRNFCFIDSRSKECRQFQSNTMFGIGRRYSRKAVEDSARVRECRMKTTCVTQQGVLKQGDTSYVYQWIADGLFRAGYADDGGETFKLWNDSATAGMDNHSNNRLNENGFTGKQLFTDEPLAADIKSEVNIWKFNPEAGQPYDLGKFCEGLSEAEIRCLESL